MLDVLTAEDVRRQDAAGEVAALMEAAGFAVARAVRGMLGATYGVRIVVVCGPGNNGGDGIVAARLLRSWGAHVTCVEEPWSSLSTEIERADLVIDALFGVGLSRPVGGEARAAVDAMNAYAGPVVSVDIPSGMDTDTGRPFGAMVHPTAVVTLSGLKPGLCFNEDIAAWIEIADIGAARVDPAAFALEEADVAAILPVRTPGAHKRGSGTALIVAGSRAMPGAASLAAAACIHAGAGLTTLAGTDRVTAVALSRTPEVTTLPLSESPEGALDEKAAEAVLARADSFSAIAIGPGLSTHPQALDAARSIVLSSSAPMVIDADAITAFAGDAGALRARRGFTILTPHEGELARLMGVEVASIRDDRLRATRDAAALTGHVVALKGHGTVIASPNGQVYINTTGNRGLAQGGTGDVLTGIIAAMLAQGRPDVALCAAAIWLHGRVADLVAERVAPHPSNASMLIELLPETMHDVFADS